MRAIQAVEVSDTGTSAQTSEIENVRNPIAKAKQFPHTKKLATGCIQKGCAINPAKMFKNKIGRNKKNSRCKKGDIFHEICVPVNKVFTPDVREQLSEVSTIQQCSPNTACPVAQAHEDDFPTEVHLDGATVLSGDSEPFYVWIEEYGRITHKEGYEILEAL